VWMNLTEKLAHFSDQWMPRTVAQYVVLRRGARRSSDGYSPLFCIPQKHSQH